MDDSLDGSYVPGFTTDEIQPKKKTIRQLVYEFIRDNPNCSGGKIHRGIGRVVDIRRIRDSTAQLLVEEVIKSKICPCGHAPLFEVVEK